MNATRYINNPIFSPADIAPTSSDYEVVGVFNPGVTTYKDKVVLLLRVAQRPKDKNDGYLRVPVFNNATKEMELMKFDKSDKTIDFSDCRIVKLASGKRYLTSFSFFRLATSEDGENFTLRANFAILPSCEYEAFGMEDSRITKIGEEYYINYSCASDFGIVTSLMKTTDFETFTRLGNMMHPDNKDVSIFPEKINGYYYTLHRPSTSEFGKPEIWLAKSPDLICWGEHKHILSVRDGWDCTRIGSSSVPFKTKEGWLVIYHGADKSNTYCLGCMLLDIEKPWKVLSRSVVPFMSPIETYEKQGFFSNVVFACGCVQNGENIDIYYGAADTYICKARIAVKELLGQLKSI